MPVPGMIQTCEESSAGASSLHLHSPGVSKLKLTFTAASAAWAETDTTPARSWLRRVGTRRAESLETLALAERGEHLASRAAPAPPLARTEKAAGNWASCDVMLLQYDTARGAFPLLLSPVEGVQRTALSGHGRAAPGARFLLLARRLLSPLQGPRTRTVTEDVGLRVRFAA